MQKRIAALLLALWMCLTQVLAAGTGDNSAALYVSLPETLPAVGETFTVSVEISGNPGICSVQFTLRSNDAVVECVSAGIGSVLTGALAAANPSASDGAIIAAANIHTMDQDGPLGVLIYRVVAEGDPEFQLTDIVLSDENLADVPYTIIANEEIAADAPEPETGDPGDGMGGSTPPEIPDTAPSTDTGDGTTPSTDAGDGTTPSTGTGDSIAPSTGMPDSAEPQTPDDETVYLFSDVPEDYWANEYIAQAVKAGWFQGYTDGSFRPGQNVTRAQLVTVLWRDAGRPEASQTAPFIDLDGLPDEFRQAAAWGYENGYVTGYETEQGLELRPNGAVTRQQAMAILYRYCGAEPGAEQLLGSVYDGQFTDSGEIASYARNAMYWALYHEIINGTSATTLSPTGLATRAQLAKILVNCLGSRS